MKKSQMILAVATYAAFMFSSVSAFATGFGLGVSGAKNVKFDNRVNTNQITFENSAPLESMKGTASGISGGLTINPDNIEATTGWLNVEVTSMKTGIDKRDKHMVASEWLDAAKFPMISFKVQNISNVKIEKNEGGRAIAKGTANGEFTMHGVTKKMSIPVTITYVKESAKTKERAPGDFVFIQADFSISLKDYNIQGTKGTIGSKVGEIVELKANLFGATGL